VQVVLLGQVGRVEVVADVDGFAVAVPLLRGVARLLGEREVLERALVGQVVVAVPVPVPWPYSESPTLSAKNAANTSSKLRSSRRSLTNARRSASRSNPRSARIPGCPAQRIASTASDAEIRSPRRRSSRMKR
jgi:hypothetical protein